MSASTKGREMLQEAVRVVICAMLACLVLFGTAMLLAGCQSTHDDAKFVECWLRDGTSRPCN
jgi:hypothetical protein